MNGERDRLRRFPADDANGNPAPTLPSDGLENYYFVGVFPSLNLELDRSTNGLPVEDEHPCADRAVPPRQTGRLELAEQRDVPERYFEVDGLTGAPVMVGEMDVDVPWFNGDVPLIMEVDSTHGLVLNYPAPGTPWPSCR